MTHQPVQIRPHTKSLHIRISGEKLALPAELRAKVEKFWREQRAAKSTIFNGEVFTVSEILDTAEATTITLAETDYAHFLYNYYYPDLGKYTLRIVHASALVITADNKLIFGEMGKHTARAGVIQCCGGGIDRKDVARDGSVDMTRSTVKELGEELGIDPYDKSRVAEFAPTYYKWGGPKNTITLVSVVRLRATGNEFLQQYGTFAEQLRRHHEEPEFDRLFCIDADAKTVKGFIAQHHDRLDEYMPMLLVTVAK